MWRSSASRRPLERYQGLPDYYWKALDPDKDDFTRQTAKEVHGGYFIRTKKGAVIPHPVQSCLYIKGKDVAQAVHNVVVVEEDSEVHIITGCATAHGVQSALHLGISEFYVKKNGRLTFTMVHNWGEQVAVRPRTAVHVEENGAFVSNYILLKPVRTMQSYPAVYLNGPGGLARFNSVIVAPEGSHVDTGNKIILNAPNTRGEIISKTITTGGTIIARGFIGGNAVPARGHLECKGLILGQGVIHAIPELVGSVPGVELSHEAAVGKIAREEIEYLMARGLDEEEATLHHCPGISQCGYHGAAPGVAGEHRENHPRERKGHVLEADGSPCSHPRCSVFVGRWADGSIIELQAGPSAVVTNERKTGRSSPPDSSGQRLLRRAKSKAASVFFQQNEFRLDGIFVTPAFEIARNGRLVAAFDFRLNAMVRQVELDFHGIFNCTMDRGLTQFPVASVSPW